MDKNQLLQRIMIWIQDEAAIEQIELEDIDDALDLRDEDLFSSSWMTAHELVESQAERGDATIDAIREAAFRKAFGKWKSSDLAACISDDFGLIAQAIALDAPSTFVAGLLHAYVQGQFPTSVIETSQEDVASVFPAP